MTLAQLMEQTASSVYIIDGKQRYWVSNWGLLYDAFKDCVINEIQGRDNGDLEITFKTQLVRE